jgi:hypothetical protein
LFYIYFFKIVTEKICGVIEIKTPELENVFVIGIINKKFDAFGLKLKDLLHFFEF